MPETRLIEHLKQLKSQSGLTSQQIADRSGIPLSTVSRILSGETGSPTFLTISALVRAMGGSLDEIAFGKQEGGQFSIGVEAIQQMESTYQAMLKTKDEQVNLLQHQMAAQQEQYEARIADFLSTRKFIRRVLVATISCLIVLLLFMMAWLVLDLNIGTIGQFRY